MTAPTKFATVQIKFDVPSVDTPLDRASAAHTLHLIALQIYNNQFDHHTQSIFDDHGTRVGSWKIYPEGV